MTTNEVLYGTMISCHFNEDLDNFNDTLKEYALLLTLKLCSQPNFPRCAAFDIISEIISYIKKITDGT